MNAVNLIKRNEVRSPIEINRKNLQRYICLKKTKRSAIHIGSRQGVIGRSMFDVHKFLSQFGRSFARPAAALVP